MGANSASDSEPDQAAAAVPGSGPDAPGALRLGRISGVLVQVRDLELSLSFYRDVLGLIVEQNDAQMALLRGADDGVRTVALLEVGPGAPHYLRGTGIARVAWQVPSSSDLDLAEQLLARNGIRYVRPRDETDSIITSDPDGVSVVILAADAMAGSPPAMMYAPE